MDFGDLLFIEQLVPRLHALVRDPVHHDLQELGRGELAIGLGQVRGVGRTVRIDAVAAVTVHVPPLPTVVHGLVGISRLRAEQRGAGWIPVGQHAENGHGEQESADAHEPKASRHFARVRPSSISGTPYSFRIAVISALRCRRTVSTRALSASSPFLMPIEMLKANGRSPCADGTGTSSSGTRWRAA